MTQVVVPLDSQGWTLGGQVADWIKENLVFGPGDLLGEPARVDAEKRELLESMYEIYPPWHNQAGRRRFRRCAISLRKGTAKTEFAAWITAAELSADAPVRCVDWEELDHDPWFRPIGDGVTDPYIPMVATTEEQSEELAYGALLAILERSEIASQFDLGLGRITRVDGRGKCEPVAAAPNPRDGARTTFQCFDEVHRMVLPRLKEAHQTMLNAIPKRKIADAWSLEITTAPQLGEGSVAEDTWDYADSIIAGKHKDASLFFFHRGASDGYDLTNEDQVREAIIDASGPIIAEWSNIEGIMDLWRDPQVDPQYFERVWLNRKVKSSSQVFNMAVITEQIAFHAKDGETRLPPRNTPIAIGFDGSKTDDATAIIGTDILRGYQFMIGQWEPRAVENQQYAEGEPWEVPVHEVEQVMEHAFQQWKVVKAYMDPYYWDTQVDTWYGKWPKQVVRYLTNQHKKMAYGIQSYLAAWNAGEVTWDGNSVMGRHLSNARKAMLHMYDEDGKQLFVMKKEGRGSPLKIDAAMAATLSWAARNDAIATGALKLSGSRVGRTTVYLGG